MTTIRDITVTLTPMCNMAVEEITFTQPVRIRSLCLSFSQLSCCPPGGWSLELVRPTGNTVIGIPLNGLASTTHYRFATQLGVLADADVYGVRLVCCESAWAGQAVSAGSCAGLGAPARVKFCVVGTDRASLTDLCAGLIADSLPPEVSFVDLLNV